MNRHQVVHFHCGFTFREGLYGSRTPGGELVQSVTENVDIVVLGFNINFEQGSLFVIHAVFEEFPGDVGLVGGTVSTD